MTLVTPVGILRREQPARRGLPSEARTYLILLSAAAAAAAVGVTLRPDKIAWRDALILLVAAPAVQLLAEHGPGNQVFHGGLVFSVAAALLLPPELAVAVCIVQHLPEWLRQRYPWYIQSFNIVNYVLSVLAASTIWHVLGADASDTRPGAIAAAICSAAVFVVVNHALLARMLRYARGRGLAETGLFSLDGLAGSAALAAIGVGFAFTLDRDPLLAVVIALPLFVVQRALTVPLLREEATRDHKTGLLNARGLERAAEHELQRALRFARPLSLIVCDVDGLRAINNNHGHLAGDAAITAVADTLCAELRDYDLCGRFGGDEFVVVLPETELEAALEVAQRVEDAVAARTISAGRTEFSVSLSIGVATTTAGHEFRLETLLAEADAAMYETKRAR
jgi:diguanylate cyclase (GGDEF)-like protein